MFITGKGYKPHESPRVEQLLTDLIVGVISTGLFFISLFYLVPSDLATTALWYESLNFQPVIIGQTPMIRFSHWSMFPDISLQATLVAVTISGLQIFLLFKAQTSGNWSGSHDTFLSLFSNWFKTTFSGKRFSANGFNYTKMSWLIMAILVAVIDCLTDGLYKSFGGMYGVGHFLSAVLFSLVFYTILSEYILVVSFKTALQHFLNVVFVLTGFISPALQQGLKSMAHSSIDIGLPTDGSGSSNSNHKQSQPNSRKNRRGRDGKERIPHSGGAHAHQQRNRENSDLPEEFLRMMEESR
jgi:hypothetical protein